MSKSNSMPPESTPDHAHLVLPTLPKIAVSSGAASPQHAATYFPPTSQVQQTPVDDAMDCTGSEKSSIHYRMHQEVAFVFSLRMLHQS